MLHQTKDLQGLAIVATDGAIGDLKDLYVDDARSWLSSHKVLISSDPGDPGHGLCRCSSGHRTQAAQAMAA